MKAILLTVSPKEARNIINGNQTALIRKRVPNNFKGWVYLYCSNGKALYEYDGKYGFIGSGKSNNIISTYPTTLINRKIVARFWLDNTEDFMVTEDGIETDGLCNLSFIDLPKATQLSLEELQQYIKVGKKGYALHIKNLEIFDTPKELSEFYNYNKFYGSFDLSTLEISGTIDALRFKESCRLTKAPSTFCYVEVVE